MAPREDADVTHTSAFPILPKAQWPDFDRRCWDDALNAQSTKSWLQELEELCVRGNVTQRKAASPSALRSTTVVNVEDAYGQYLAFLEPPLCQ